MDKQFERVAGARKISYDELAHVTNSFSEQNKLGRGGFGEVYKGLFNDSNGFSEGNIYVAVKRIFEVSIQGIKDYTSELMIASQVRHKNLIQLIGWCHEKRELLLVFEYMPNLSLDCHLFNAEKLLTWEQRYTIGKDLASALNYLHEECKQCVLHRDIKSSNVMLDANFNPILGDFGLARLMHYDMRSQTLQGGTEGYIAPECYETGKSTKESDVYSYGVVLLEIACGRKPFVPTEDGNWVRLVKWVWDLYGSGKLFEAVDQKLYGDFDREAMKRLMIVGLSCAHPHYQLRPKIGEAMNMLKFIEEPYTLPANFPQPTHPIPSGSLTSSDSSNFSSSFEASLIQHRSRARLD
ncbi:hypothetical protein GH714_028857 [Hevea brasiliensis]|uniref:Protein kinase domain-containing protein n=1 Tax=Hevea brasiliensis TaxID=3981 RepID=A0A6A6N4L6_HEVBR|nr:hypothetical protein GH714_028857 [Hevea brasiliensis]